MRQRLVVAIACGLFGGLVSHFFASVQTKPRDFAQVWFAARAVLHGQDPYALVGPGLAFDWPAPLLYPMPAVLAAVPLAPLPLPVACGVFMAIGVTALAFALTRHGWGPLLGLLSVAVYFAAEVVQWSPLLTASIVLPPLAVLLVAKPTIGAAMFVARPSRWAIIGGVILLAAAFAVDPGWLGHWRDAVARNAAIQPPTAPYHAPVTLPGGALALLCLLRWRRPEARLVAALACVPQTLLLYETVPLLLVPRRWWQSAMLVAGSVAVQWLTPTQARALPLERLAVSGQWIVLLLYLPCVTMVLARPNEGVVPAWLERRMTAWPAWLRGSPIPATS